jgi:hypothetical protein
MELLTAGRVPEQLGWYAETGHDGGCLAKPGDVLNNTQTFQGLLNGTRTSFGTCASIIPGLNGTRRIVQNGTRNGDLNIVGTGTSDIGVLKLNGQA